MTEQPGLTGATGPWPFITRRFYLHEGEHLNWYSRTHRKGLGGKLSAVQASEWQPQTLNLWITWGFAIGAFLFVAGSVLSLWPDLAQRFALTALQVGAVYFAGSIFFTGAAYLQLFQAANTGLRMPDGSPQERFVWLGWQPGNIGWLSSALQFPGTLLFNVNTFMAMGAPGTWLLQDLTIWAPDIIGSVLFLLSGYLAFVEVCHRYWAWRWREFSWWVGWVNLLGCVAFMVSAIYAFVPFGADGPTHLARSTGWTLVGAIGFLAGAVLLMVESRGSDQRPGKTMAPS